MIDKFGKAILTMFGVGYFKYAPGTAASFLTCIIFYLLYTSSFYIGQGPAVIVCILLIILVYSIIIIDKLSYLFKKTVNSNSLFPFPKFKKRAFFFII